MIQKQIYLASQKYNLVLVHKLQKYLLNCNEAKIISINQVLKDMYLYYFFYNKEQYLFEHSFKFFICEYFFNYQKIKKTKKVLQNIHQHLFSLCIQPEWQAKCPKYLITYFNNDNIHVKLFKDVNKYNKSQINKNLFYKSYIIKKLKSFRYINESIKQWLQHGFYFSLNNIFNLKSKELYKQISFSFNSFYYLLLKIINIDTLWYFFFLLNTANFYQFNYNIKKKFSFKTSDLSKIKFFTNEIKNLLYRKNYLDHLKINTNIKKHDLLCKISKRIKTIYNYCFQMINLVWIQSMYKLVNILLYYWLKKIDFTSFYKLYKIQIKQKIYFINFYIYSCNIKKYYVYLF